MKYEERVKSKDALCENEKGIMIYKYPIWILQLIMDEKLNPQYKIIIDEALYLILEAFVYLMKSPRWLGTTNMSKIAWQKTICNVFLTILKQILRLYCRNVFLCKLCGASTTPRVKHVQRVNKNYISANTHRRFSCKCFINSSFLLHKSNI